MFKHGGGEKEGSDDVGYARCDATAENGLACLVSIVLSSRMHKQCYLN